MSKRPRPITAPAFSDYEDGPIRFRNKTGGSLTRGTLVYLSGEDAASGLLTATKADADASGKEAQWVVITSSVANNGQGVLGKFARVTGVNTNGATSAGDPVFLSTTAGGWTATEPTAANAISQVVGFVDTKHASAGIVEIRIPSSPRKIGTNELADGAVMAAKLGSDVTGNPAGVDNSTIEVNATLLRVKAAGITANELGVTAGAVTASKALVVDTNKDLADGTNRIRNLTVSGALTAVGAVAGATLQGNRVTVAASADGAITIANKFVPITKAGICAMTLADPTATTHDGLQIDFISTTANAHTLDNSAGSGFFSSGGASKDVATFGGAIGDRLSVIAYQGKWYILNSLNVTLG